MKTIYKGLLLGILFTTSHITISQASFFSSKKTETEKVSKTKIDQKDSEIKSKDSEIKLKDNEIKSKDSAAKRFTISHAGCWGIAGALIFSIVGAFHEPIYFLGLLSPIATYLIAWTYEHTVKIVSEKDTIQWINQKLNIPKEKSILMPLVLGIAFFCIGAALGPFGWRILITYVFKLPNDGNGNAVISPLQVANTGEAIITALAGGALGCMVLSCIYIILRGIGYIPKIIIGFPLELLINYMFYSKSSSSKKSGKDVAPDKKVTAKATKA